MPRPRLPPRKGVSKLAEAESITLSLVQELSIGEKTMKVRSAEISAWIQAYISGLERKIVESSGGALEPPAAEKSKQKKDDDECSPPANKKLKTAPILTQQQVKKMKVREIQKELKARGLKAAGKKPHLCQRLLRAVREEEKQRSKEEEEEAVDEDVMEEAKEAAMMEADDDDADLDKKPAAVERPVCEKKKQKEAPKSPPRATRSSGSEVYSVEKNPRTSSKVMEIDLTAENGSSEKRSSAVDGTSNDVMEIDLTAETGSFEKRSAVDGHVEKESLEEKKNVNEQSHMSIESVSNPIKQAPTKKEIAVDESDRMSVEVLSETNDAPAKKESMASKEDVEMEEAGSIHSLEDSKARGLPQSLLKKKKKKAAELAAGENNSSQPSSSKKPTRLNSRSPLKKMVQSGVGSMVKMFSMSPSAKKVAGSAREKEDQLPETEVSSQDDYDAMQLDLQKEMAAATIDSEKSSKKANQAKASVLGQPPVRMLATPAIAGSLSSGGSAIKSGGSAFKSKSVKAKNDARLAELRGKSKPVTSSKPLTTPTTFTKNLASLKTAASSSKFKNDKRKLLSTQMREKALRMQQKGTSVATAPKSPAVASLPSLGSHTSGSASSDMKKKKKTVAAKPSIKKHTPPSVKSNKKLTPPSVKSDKSDLLSPMSTYEMSDHEDSDSDSDSDSEYERTTKPIPSWAQKVNLIPHLQKQFADHGPDPDKIFGEVRTCDLEKIFEQQKKRYAARNSTGNWAADKVTVHEQLAYKRAMKYAH